MKTVAKLVNAYLQVQKMLQKNNLSNVRVSCAVCFANMVIDVTKMDVKSANVTIYRNHVLKYIVKINVQMDTEKIIAVRK